MMSHVQAQVQRSGGGASGFKQEGARVRSQLSKHAEQKGSLCKQETI